MCIFYFTQFSYTILLREMGQNVNTNLQHSIDIKPIKTDISQEMRRFYCIWNEVDGAFFEFRVNSGKGHRFFYEVFRKLSIYYSQAGVSGSAKLSDIWVGGGTKVLPGVTIGSNVVIGTGSVVTKDIPDGVTAFGNPCRVHRKLTEEELEGAHVSLI